MRFYVIKRLLLAIPTIFLVSVIVFSMIRLIPGDVIDLVLAELEVGSVGGGAGRVLSRADIALMLGIDLDAPLFVQYVQWVEGVFLHGDLGVSIWQDVPVAQLILARWPVTFELGFLGLIMALIIALPIGVYSALRQDTWGDYVARSFAIVCIAVPIFWLATLVIVFPAIWWGHMSPIALLPFTEDPIGNLGMFIIPASILAMEILGAVMRMTRTMMLEVLRQDYIRTAWAKGLRERTVIIRHALRNALIPVTSLVGVYTPVLVGGTIIIENIFMLPGMGNLMLTACERRDYPVVSGTMLVFGAVMVLINLIVDLSYGFLDPRIHYK